jgi:hypothetical protein
MLVNARVYSLRAVLLATVFPSIVAGGDVKALPAAHYRSLQRFGMTLMPTVTAMLQF